MDLASIGLPLKFILFPGFQQYCAADGRFVASGMIAGLKGVMSKHMDKEEVIEAATATLAEIASQKDYGLKVHHAGVVTDALAALELYPDNEQLLAHALKLVANVAMCSPELVDELKKTNVVDVLVAALDRHPDNDELLDLGARALKLLAGEADISSSMISVGNNLATANALAKVSSLLLVDENVEFMCQNNGVSWLIEALQSALGDKSEVTNLISRL